MSVVISVAITTIIAVIVTMVLSSLIESLYKKIYTVDKSSRWRTLCGIAGRLLLIFAVVCFLSVPFKKYVGKDDETLIAFSGIATIALLVFQSSLLSDIGRLVAF